MSANPTPITWDVSDADARHVITQAINASSQNSFDVEWRSFEFTMQSGVGDRDIEVTVHHADAPEDHPGATYAIHVTRLGWCDDHRRTYHAKDRLCVECVIEQMIGDE